MNNPQISDFIVGVPGKQMGWMSRHGHVLKPGLDGVMVCPESGFRYREVTPGSLKCLDLDEEKSLPGELGCGNKRYGEYKAINSQNTPTSFK